MTYDKQHGQCEGFVRDIVAECDEEKVGGIASEEVDGLEVQEENSDSEQSAEEGESEDYDND